MGTIRGPVTLGPNSTKEDREKVARYLSEGSSTSQLIKSGNKLKNTDKEVNKMGYKCINCGHVQSEEGFCKVCGDNTEAVVEEVKEEVSSDESVPEAEEKVKEEPAEEPVKEEKPKKKSKRRKK